ncbi:MAG TPA: hypothetical protein ENK44_06340 [Caldithrix abyssi]|uniref:Uncharacterized protein n=1 Tax=Caldithrix abyssi TaxID=187145 RepID=A0A7V4UD46_CALAY|nr:hypothetical protein [Caldithrix abyssi]
MKHIRKIVFLSILTFTYCTNPFSVRDVEEPGFGSDWVRYAPATSPDSVMYNFRLAIANKNVEEYMRTFVDPLKADAHQYRFVPDPYYTNDFPTAWTLDDERNFFSQLVQSDKQDYPKLRLDFLTPLVLTGITPISVDDSVESNNLEYTLQVDYGDSSEVYTGIARFKLYHSKSAPPETWHIYYWQDNAVEQNHDKTWTYLKRFIFNPSF